MVTWSFAEEKVDLRSQRRDFGKSIGVRHCGPSKLQRLDVIKYLVEDMEIPRNTTHFLVILVDYR